MLLLPPEVISRILNIRHDSVWLPRRARIHALLKTKLGTDLCELRGHPIEENTLYYDVRMGGNCDHQCISYEVSHKSNPHFWIVQIVEFPDGHMTYKVISDLLT